MKRHEYFAGRLEQLRGQYPGLINGPYGEGMMVGFTPGDGSFDHAKKLMTTMYDVGLLGFVCGSEPTRLRFLPPPIGTTFEHIDAAIDLLEQSLKRFAEQIG
jgi:acetylornithine aminotransferase